MPRPSAGDRTNVGLRLPNNWLAVLDQQRGATTRQDLLTELLRPHFEPAGDTAVDLAAQLGAPRDQAEKLRGQAPSLRVVTEDDRSPEERFLYQLAAVYRPELAAELAAVTMEDLAIWRKDKKFRVRYDQMRARCLARVEHDLLAIGRGQIRGNATALTSWLEANTLEYGLVRRDFVRQKVDAIMAEVLKILRDELTKEQMERFRVRFRQVLKKFLDKLPD